MNYIDLFAGCGGLSLGFYNAGIKGLFAVEKNKDAFSTLDYNLISNTQHFMWPKWLEKKNWDIDKLLIEHREELLTLRNKVDIITGGPPCQGFSLAGLRKTDDIRNQLMHSYIEFVKLINPKVLIFENVHGFTVAFKDKDNKKGIPFSEVLIKDLQALNYKVDYKVVNMSDYGVPQKRKRFILFATREEIDEKIFFSKLESNREQFLAQKEIVLPVTVELAISDLEKRWGETTSPDSKNFQNGKYGLSKSNFQNLMRGSAGSGEVVDSHRFAKHKDETIRIFKELMEVSEKSMRITPSMNLVVGLKKRGVTPLKNDTVCPTITSIPDDFIHYCEPRIMTVREHARIQSFPDSYHFKGPYTTGGERRKKDVPRYTQVANAIPPLFSEQVGYVIQELIQEIG